MKRTWWRSLQCFGIASPFIQLLSGGDIRTIFQAERVQEEERRKGWQCERDGWLCQKFQVFLPGLYLLWCHWNIYRSMRFAHGPGVFGDPHCCEAEGAAVQADSCGREPAAGFKLIRARAREGCFGTWTSLRRGSRGRNLHRIRQPGAFAVCSRCERFREDS